MPALVYAEALECSVCHADKAEAKHTHPAVQMGCTSCHGSVDATDIPHDFGGSPKGLNAEAPDLCFFCHDAGLFSGKEVQHAPVAGGMCLTCHDPHGSAVEKLMRAPKPDGCYDCHDKAFYYGPTVHEPVGVGDCELCHEPHQGDNPMLLKKVGSELCFSCHSSEGYSGKSVHAPIAAGNCTECHLPHSSQNAGLLQRKGNLLCRKCHALVEKIPHAVLGFNEYGHPLRGRKDPGRPGKIFGCESCHVPHASEWPTLYRYEAESMFDLCNHCHMF
jgi:predicted CXXCH cytochrome family protein